MNSSTSTSLLKSALVVSVLGFNTLHPVNAQAENPDKLQQWQHGLLFNPTAGQLRREQRGSIFIFDGLKDTTVELAMETQFDRLESMMFVRTIVTDEQGEPVLDEESGGLQVEDDGC